MRQAWVVVAVLVGAVDVASADRVARVPCPEPVSLGRSEPLLRIESDDFMPPAEPATKVFDIFADSEGQMLVANGPFSEDTTRLHWAIVDSAGTLHVVADAKHKVTCIGGAIVPGTVRVTIAAVDRAGNETVFVKDASSFIATPRRHHRHNHYGMLLIVLGPVLLIGLGLGFLVFRVIRRSQIRNATPEPVSLLAAETITRAILRMNVAMTAIGIVCTIGALAAEREVLALACALAPLVGVQHMWTCRRALRLIGRHDTVTERRGRAGSSSGT